MSESAKFKPVHHADLTRAVALSIDSPQNSQLAVRGSEEVSSRALLSLVEKSCGVEEGKTKARFEIPILPIGKMLEEFLVGVGVDTNMAEMINYFEENQDAPVTGTDFWQATGT